MNTFILFVLIVFGILIYLFMEQKQQEIKQEIQSMKTKQDITMCNSQPQPQPQPQQPIIIQQPQQPIIPYTYIVEQHDHGYHPKRFLRL
jgi:hypothetical protein